MKQEIKTKWVEALRSGKYSQAYGRLRSLDDKYCSLGILEDILNNEPQYITWGFSADDIGRILSLNDKEKVNFPNIADFIENNVMVE